MWYLTKKILIIKWFFSRYKLLTILFYVLLNLYYYILKLISLETKLILFISLKQIKLHLIKF